MFFFLIFMFCYSRLDLGVLKMLIRVCFRDVLQPGVYWFVSGMIWLSASLYSKCTVIIYSKSLLFASISYVKKVLSQTRSIMDKSVFLYWWFSFDL